MDLGIAVDTSQGFDLGRLVAVENQAILGSPAPAVAIEGLTKAFGDNLAVSDLDLDIPRGQTVALLGPNGAGKSTTIGMLAALVNPDRGRVSVRGHAPREAVKAGLVGVMLQDAGLMPGVSVQELLIMTRGLYSHPLSMEELVSSADLGPLLSRRVDRISGGESRRVRFALAIAGDPEIIVLDEPTAAMDVESRQRFWLQMRVFTEAGKTILFSTHYLEEADDAADRIVVLAGGRKVADGTPDSIKASVGERRVRFTLTNEQTYDLATMPAVTRAERHGNRITLSTADADATVRALVGTDLQWTSLEVTGIDLDSVFLRLTRGEK